MQSWLVLYSCKSRCAAKSLSLDNSWNSRTRKFPCAHCPSFSAHLVLRPFFFGQNSFVNHRASRLDCPPYWTNKLEKLRQLFFKIARAEKMRRYRQRSFNSKFSISFLILKLKLLEQVQYRLLCRSKSLICKAELNICLSSCTRINKQCKQNILISAT